MARKRRKYCSKCIFADGFLINKHRTPIERHPSNCTVINQKFHGLTDFGCMDYKYDSATEEFYT